jgi:dihydrofolate reductase
MNFSAIVAHDTDRVIGGDNKLLWNLPEDLKRFRDITMGAPIVMGRKTFESIGKPLPGRENIILTRDTNFKVDGCFVYNDMESIIADYKNSNEVFIIGGGEIYKLFFPHIDRLYITVVEGEYEGDTHFPHYSDDLWSKFFENRFDGFRYESWIRKKKLSSVQALTSRIIEINYYLTSKIIRRRNKQYQPHTGDVDHYLRLEVEKLIKEKEKFKRDGIDKRSKSREIQSVTETA